MSTLITDSDELTHFTAVFQPTRPRRRPGTRLSCIEVEALAGLLRALGEPATADTWIANTPPTTKSATHTIEATPPTIWS